MRFYLNNSKFGLSDVSSIFNPLSAKFNAHFEQNKDLLS